MNQPNQTHRLELPDLITPPAQEKVEPARISRLILGVAAAILLGTAICFHLGSQAAGTEPSASTVAVAAPAGELPHQSPAIEVRDAMVVSFPSSEADPSQHAMGSTDSEDNQVIRLVSVE